MYAYGAFTKGVFNTQIWLGNMNAVTIKSDLAKYLVTIPNKNKSSNEVAKAIFEGFVLIYGPMVKLLADMGTEYMNTILYELFVPSRESRNY